MAAPSPPIPSGAPATLRDLAEELAREDRDVLQPLYRRAGELAERLWAGVALDPAYLREGVELWNRYLNDVYERRLERLLIATPLDAARAVRPRHRRFGRAGSAGLPVTPEEEQYREVRQDPARMAERVGALHDALEGYARGQFGSAQLLGSLLRSIAFSDRAWMELEQRVVGRSSDRTLTDESATALAREVADSEPLRAELEPRIRAYLARPVPVLPAP
ncbi:MAG TPA: hypothetical protein VMG99_02435 [Thermoplasmata archaeon]|nr:hypothetical protein [Thermoplasmata archaeon]